MIRTNYSAHQTPQFRVLSELQCHELYLATLECLQRVGVQVGNAEARQLLSAAGAQVEGERVYIPAFIIQDGLNSAPRTFTVWGRDYQHKLEIAPDRVYFGPGPTCSNFIDPISGQRRPAQRGDAALTARLCDALENMDYLMGLSLFSDVPAHLSPVYEFAEMVANSTKPILAWAFRTENVKDIYRIAVAVAGSEKALQRKPLFAFFATYKSPLQHTEEDLSHILWAAAHGIPVIYLGGPTVGLESPMTGASALVIHLATVLSGLAIIQLKKRGAPFVGGGVPSAMDLRNARPAYGSPEMSLHCAAASDLARSLGLPFMGTAAASESKLLDAQAGIETTLQVLLSALSGACLVHDAGFLDCADLGSLGMLVMADEIISMTQRILRGVPVSQETIMLDLIEKVGPGGSFLTERRSSSLSRNEIWLPTLMDRAPYALWEQAGANSMADRVKQKLSKILQTHHPMELPKNVDEKIQAILREMEEKTH